jgi:tRNA/tmRNA/rRNA uracil-C5-methylase (TrmA/RlmC/RlmD family)
MHPDALPEILKFDTNQIIYVSCDPSTLARDL